MFAAEIKPSIESCLTKAIAADGTEVVSNIGSSKCSEQKNFYGRNQINHFLVDLNFVFTINVNMPARPAFVSHELFGITDVDIVLETISVTGNVLLLYIIVAINKSRENNLKRSYSLLDCS